MKKLKKLKMLPSVHFPTKKKGARSSPNGKVHAVNWYEDNGEVHVECGYRSWRGELAGDWGNKWERTYDPVTCKTCLRVVGEIKYFTVTRAEAAAIRTILDKSKRYARYHNDYSAALKAVRKWDLEIKDGEFK